MIAFEISLNGRPLCTAGVGDHGVLSAIVTWTLRNPAALVAHPVERREEAAREELRIEVGGSTGANLYHWPSAALGPGDEVLVRICETSTVDPPSDSCPHDPDHHVAAQRDYVRRMCQQWGWRLTES